LWLGQRKGYKRYTFYSGQDFSKPFLVELMIKEGSRGLTTDKLDY